MKYTTLKPDKSISLFVKSILVFENDDSQRKTSLPFSADGCPGLMFQQTENELTVIPHNKKMPPLFLYGQTIQPIQLEIDGSYLLIIFQLYPFVLKAFWNITPEKINDNCYYLTNTAGRSIDDLTNDILSAGNVAEKFRMLSEILLMYYENKRDSLDFEIRDAIQYIIETKGQMAVASITKKTHLNLRTFERRFKKETGLSPKRFAQIIQFSSSLQQLTVKDFTKLTDIVYENGFADQSHFIRVFKAFTGKTPGSFRL